MQPFKLIVLPAIFSMALLVCSCNNKTDKEKSSTETTKKEETTTTESSEKATDPIPETDVNDIVPGGLEFLKNFNGKYPSDVKLLDNPLIQARLNKLLAGRFDFLKETWSIENQIQVNNNIFVASACEAHNCDNTNFIIVADLSKNIMYAGIREEGKVTKYAEDGGSNAELNKWAEGNN